MATTPRKKVYVVKVDENERADLRRYVDATGRSVSEAMRNGAFLYYETMLSATQPEEGRVQVAPSSNAASTMQALYRDGRVRWPQAAQSRAPESDERLDALDLKVRALEAQINASMRGRKK